ncbi:MAG: homocysteine S-methyltransferase family protein [Selenomonadaceae bacterium]|nr:homocysteine S-methyltransferase family protein [Selenomonadaceae bacterium]
MSAIHILDGAMGTMLQAGGLKQGACPELMNVENPEVVQKIHAAYLAAGANIIETNTFGASPLKLSHYGLSDRADELNAAAVGIARKAIVASSLPGKIAGSMGPTGRFVYPLGDLDFEVAYQNFRRQARALAEAGADYLIIETCIDLQEMRAALLAAKDVCDLPIICQLSYSEDGRTVTGTDPLSAAVTLAAMGADIIGANCSLGPKQLLPIVEELFAATNKPVSVLPNAGMPFLERGVTKFPMQPEEFGTWGRKLAEAGASFIGGCCGTTPAHIKCLADALQGVTLPTAKAKKSLVLTSRSSHIVIDKTLPPRLIGERINPTGRKQMAAEIKNGSLLAVKKEALGQAKAGAHILDVNMGVPGIDQAKAMQEAVTQIAQISPLPLVIDTGDPAALEAGLRAYPGRALVNSVTAEKERLKTFLPLAKKYGAAVLCLPITDEGVPKTAQDRVKVMGAIIEAAKEAGLTDGDFLLDALVMTVSAEPRAALEVLETLRLYREEFGYPTTMGLSNISFGLPNRPLINSVFFAQCLTAGLDAPIMNPYDEAMQNTLAASLALLGHDPGGLSYSQQAVQEKIPPAAAALAHRQLAPLAAVKSAIKEGAKDEVADLVEKAIAAGHSGNEITEKALTAAMNELGVAFGAGKIFLPQVLLSAETMRAAFDKIKSLLPTEEQEKLGTVVMATVKGDVHDLGKNITGALLSNSGFQLIDLGKDVESAAIVKAALENKADIVGLCALMTTTMPEIDKVIVDLRSAGSRAKVMVGGAALTQEYADSAGADAYAKDAVKAVELAKQLVD